MFLSVNDASRSVRPPPCALLRLQLQAVDEDRLHLVDVVAGFDGDAEPAGRAGEPARVHAVAEGPPAGPRRVLRHVQEEPAVVRRLEAVVEVGVVLGPRAVAGAVGHQARLQAAVPAHRPVEVEPRDQRLSDVDAPGPVDGGVFSHGGKRALKADGEDQLLLREHGGGSVKVRDRHLGGGPIPFTNLTF